MELGKQRMQIIFNADDFGLTQGVNDGIVDAFRQGVVRSTTLMVGMPAEQHAVELAHKNSELRVGLHLRLTTGKPLTQAATLVNEHGQFLSLVDWQKKLEIDANDVYQEFVSQVEHFLQLGIPLSHLDSHHHIHMHSAVAPIAHRVAQQYQVPLRGIGWVDNKSHTSRYCFTDQFYDQSISVEQMKQVIEKYMHNVDILEVMCHPAYVDNELKKLSSYQQQREEELKTLTAPEFLRFLKLHDIRVTDYSVLAY